MSRDERNSVSEADVLIVTVTKVESRAIMEAFKTEGDRAVPQSIGNRVYFNLGTVNGARVFLTQSEMGTEGLGAALLATTQSIEALSPLAIVMVGIAFGVDEEKQAIGDILVAKQLRLYDLQRVGTHEDGKPKMIWRGDKPAASPWLVNLFKGFDLLWKGTEVHFGTVLTGEKLVDNLDFREQLRHVEEEAIGGEMEGAGLYAACQTKKVDWILIKGICDWADGHKSKDKKNRQQIAATNAAEFVLGGLKFVAIDWQKRRGERTNQSSSQSTQGTNSPNINNVEGDVHLNSGKESRSIRIEGNEIKGSAYTEGNTYYSGDRDS